MGSELNHKQEKFVKEYIYDWNATRAYKVAYPDYGTDENARASSSRLLTNVNIQDYITEIQKDLEKLAGISRQRVLEEHMKIAFSSIAHLHNTWIDRKEFEELTEQQKACIAEIDVKQVNSKEKGYNVEQVKIKLYDKQKALESISRMLGYNEAEKHELKIPEKIVFENVSKNVS